jgi:hypothetical protein
MMIRSNYTESPCWLSAANRASSIRFRSRSIRLRSKAEGANHYRLRTDGSLRDISPMLLAILKLGEPKEMTGGDLREAIAK